MTTAHDPPEVHARVREGLPLVEAVAVQLRRELLVPMPREDLVSFGREGLLRAARSYDASHGVPFGAWATFRIRGAIIDGVRAWGPLPRRVFRRLRELAAADAIEEGLALEDAARPPQSPEDADERLSRYLTEMSTAMVLDSGLAKDPDDEEIDTTASPEKRLESAEVARILREAVARLPDDERTVIERYYFDEASLDDAARAVGLSKSWASRLHTRAVERLTRDLKRTRALLR